MKQTNLKIEKPKKLFLIFHGRFPSNKAASLFAAKSAEAFADEGMLVELIVPRRLHREPGDQYNYYRIKKNFRIIYLPVLDIPVPNFMTPLRFITSSLSASLSCYWYLLRHAKKTDIIYSNEYLPLFLASFSFPQTFYEMHDFPESGKSLFGGFLRRMRWVLIHNNWKAQAAKKIFKINESRIICEPNAVQIEDFDIAISKEDARRKLNLPKDKKIVVYTGHLYSWKGVDTLALAAKELPDDYLVVFVGGVPEDIKKLSDAHNNETNILIAGWRPHEEIPLWQKAADVLLLPNTSKENISKYYTSPMKLFEYMASKRPIVATDIPSIREVLDESNAVIVTPDDPKSMADGIISILTNNTYKETVTEKAYRDVAMHTWRKRAKRILDFIMSNR